MTVIARQQGVLECKLGAYGVDVRWIGFSSGLSMLEAMDTGSVDAGQVGDTPPIFAQAAGAAIAYVAAQTMTSGPGFSAGQNSDNRTPADSFYVSNRDFVARYPDVLRDVIETLARTATWAAANRDEAAKLLADDRGIELETHIIAAGRPSFAIGALTAGIIASQQAIADRCHRLGLIPRPIDIRDAVWTGAQSGSMNP